QQIDVDRTQQRHYGANADQQTRAVVVTTRRAKCVISTVDALAHAGMLTACFGRPWCIRNRCIVRGMDGHGEAWNMRLLAQTDLHGHGDCRHGNLKARYAFVGHMGESRVGTSVVDVSDPRQPRLVKQLETPPGTHSHKVQVVDDILLVNYERSMYEPNAST